MAQPFILPPARLAILYAVMLVAAAGNTAMQSVLPTLGAKLGIADVLVTLAFSWSAFLWVITAPYWAKQSDQKGRRALMALGVVGFVLSMGLCGLSLFAGLSGWISGLASFGFFALFRSVYGGFGSASPPAVQAYIAARTQGEERTKALSFISSSFGLGTIIGPTIAPFLILPVVGLSGPLFAFAAIGAALLIGLRTILPNDDPRFAAKGQVAAYPNTASLPSNTDTADTDIEEDAPISPKAVPEPIENWRDSRIWPWMVGGLVGGHANAMILGVAGFYVMDVLALRSTPELAAKPIALVMMAGALATLVAQWGLIPTLHLKPRTAMLWGVLIGGFGCAMIGISGDLYGIMLGMAVASLGFGLFRPGFTAGASLAVGRSLQGRVAGLVASVNGAAYIAAPAIGVLLYQWHAWASFGMMFALCAGLFIWGRKSLEVGH
jgi:MFS family permease